MHGDLSRRGCDAGECRWTNSKCRDLGMSAEPSQDKCHTVARLEKCVLVKARKPPLRTALMLLDGGMQETLLRSLSSRLCSNFGLNSLRVILNETLLAAVAV